MTLAKIDEMFKKSGVKHSNKVQMSQDVYSAFNESFGPGVTIKIIHLEGASLEIQVVPGMNVVKFL